jgi:heterodisulfide reductase subunit C
MGKEKTFIQEVSERSGYEFGGCFHCMCCSGGCPAAPGMDYLPNQILRMVQLGMRKEVLESRSIWMCIGCYACLTECPNRIHIPHMMDALREMALEADVKIGEPEIWNFHKEFLKQVKKRGRVYEIEFMMRYKFATKTFFQDVGAGLKMLRLGRMELLPSSVRNTKIMNKIWEACKNDESEKR